MKYQPKVGGVAKGGAKDITVPADKTHQGDEVSYTPEEITEGGKVYVPKTPGEQTVTLTDKPQTVDVTYVEKSASTEVKYQPKVDGVAKGSAKDITVPTDKTHQGDEVSYTPEEITEDGKVYVPKTPGEQTVTLTDKPQIVDVTYVEKPTTSTPIFTVGTQDPTNGNVDVTVTGVPDGTKVKLPGIDGEKVVTGGKVTLTNDELPGAPKTGKGSAQESGKLPKEGTSDITIPGKLTSGNGQPETQEDIPEYTKPIGTTGVDENGNLIAPPVIDIPEYTGPIGTTGVDENGNLIEPPIKHQTKLIITKWTDEAGNELKSADVKAPKILGETNEALNVGEIAGYEFVRTETSANGEVVTYIFRKVTLTDENIKQTPTGKVEKFTKRLANTGATETNRGLSGVGLSMLGGLLAVAKRRKKDEA